MLKKFQIVIVPQWLQSTVDSGNLNINDTTNIKALGNILSKHDLISYYIANRYFTDNVVKSFSESFCFSDFSNELPFDLSSELSLALRYGEATTLKNYWYYLDSTVDDNADGFIKKLGFDVIKCDGSVLWLKPILVKSEDLIDSYNNLFKAMYPFVPLQSLVSLPIFKDYEQMIHNETAMLKL